MSVRFTDEELTSWGKSDGMNLKHTILQGTDWGHRSTVKIAIEAALSIGKNARGLSVGREQITYRQAFEASIDEILSQAGIGGRSFWT